MHPLRFVVECGLPIGAAAIYCQWAGHKKLRDGCWMIAWSCLFVNLLQLPTYAAARSRFPLADSTLVRFDLLLGINSGVIVAWTHQHPVFEAFSIWSYGLMPWMVCAAVIIPPITGSLRRAKEFLLATILAALIATLVLTIFPAIGPWDGFHFQPYWNQAFYSSELAALRAPGAFTANPGYATGLITFPSFHVALALLSAYSLWPLRWLRIPATVAAALITMATVTTGWHYASDGIGGALVAWAGITVARRVVESR